MQRLRILDVDFDPVGMEEAATRVMDRIARSDRGWLMTVNVATVVMMRSDDALRRFAERACLVVADGQPIVWLGAALGLRFPERVAGIDLLLELARRGAGNGTALYLLGGRPGVAMSAATALQKACPGLLIAGAADGYFSQDEAPARVRAIRESGAQILIVGMGTPRQERFIEENWAGLGTSIAIGVGGSLDVIAGRRTRAPRVMQQAGLEWSFRLAQEPSRLFWRYSATNVQFALLLAARLVRRTMSSSRRR